MKDKAENKTKNKLKELIQDNSAAFVAVRCGVSVSTLYNWIEGRSYPNVRSIIPISRAVQLSISQVVNDFSE